MNLTNKQNKTAKTLAYGIRYTKMLSYFIVEYATILMVWYFIMTILIGTNNLDAATGFTIIVIIAMLFKLFDYGKKMVNIRGYVDGKFRKTIPDYIA